MNTEDQLGIQTSFETVLKDADLQSLTADVAETALDSFLDTGALRDFPVIGNLVGLSKFALSVRDRLFMKKVLTFLIQLHEVSADKRKEMIDTIDSSKKFRIKVGEKLLYIIDTCHDHEASERIGVLFRAYLKEVITYDDFLKSAAIMERLTISDFNWLIRERKSHYFDLDDIGDLVSSGLFELHYEQVDVQVEEETDRKTILENPNRKYKAEVGGGGISVHLSRAGETILEVFCVSYKKPKTIKI